MDCVRVVVLTNQKNQGWEVVNRRHDDNFWSLAQAMQYKHIGTHVV